MDLVNKLQNFSVLQRNDADVSEHPFSGSCCASGTVLLTVKTSASILPGFDKIAVGTARNGKISGVISGLPVGGPYSLTLQIAGSTEKKIFNNILVGDLWLLAGQSNMSDSAFLPSLVESDPMVHAYYMTNQWDIAQDPLHDVGRAAAPVHGGRPDASPKSASGRGAGPGLPFGIAMYKATGIPQGLIACAHGGTSLEQWAPEKKKLRGHSLYGAMYERLQDLGGKVAGLLWHQGCNETRNEEQTDLYSLRTRKIFAAVRRDCGDPALPIVMAQLGALIASHGDTTVSSRRWLQVRNQQYLLPRQVKNLVCVPTIDLPLSDRVHISNRAVAILGQRMADAMQYLRDPVHNLPQITFKKMRISRQKVNGDTIAELTFDNVAGELTSSGNEPCGFGLLDSTGKYVSDAINCRLEGNRAIIQLPISCVSFYENCQIAYGGNFQPHANIVDSAGRSLPCFAVSGKKRPTDMTCFVTDAMAAGPFYGNDALENLQLPSEQELADMKFAPAGFSSFYVICPPPEENSDVTAQRHYCFRFKLDLSEAMKLKVLFGADAPFALYCDRQELLRKHTSNPVELDEFSSVLKLDAGRHEFILMFSSNSGRGWGFCCRFVRQDGKNAPEVVTIDQFD